MYANIFHSIMFSTVYVFSSGAYVYLQIQNQIQQIIFSYLAKLVAKKWIVVDLNCSTDPCNWSIFVSRSQSTVECTYIYRVQSSVWRLPNYWPTTPSPPSECVLPRTKGGDVIVHTRRAVRGWWWVNISEDARHWIGLLQYNPSLRPDVQPDPEWPACVQAGGGQGLHLLLGENSICTIIISIKIGMCSELVLSVAICYELFSLFCFLIEIWRKAPGWWGKLAGKFLRQAASHWLARDLSLLPIGCKESCEIWALSHD